MAMFMSISVQYGDFPLSEAALNGHLAVVVSLVAKKADIEVANSVSPMNIQTNFKHQKTNIPD